ncbi:M24 family metallopeptidase [Micromonospora cathayae]|uniref:Xaa-Pro peptidase family protein n=1 Tax=Micromonospora cathayae TaxID=3028804 RepID=A0ABY7ZGY7_9ACTN|nr:Xaa-Pro peptidase family protein [Micromonospora sp. HUAS 3]WDZ82180.1 Xaa-Pro peptidase family protein [Micromonospora sp. HUAS 3]
MFANLERLARFMDEQGLDGLVATTIENVYYLTGVAAVGLEIFPHTGQAYAVVTRDALDKPHFVASRCDIDQALDAAVEIAGAVGYGIFYRELPDGVELTDREKKLVATSVDAPTVPTPLDALVETLRRAGLDGARIGLDEDGVGHGYPDALREKLPGLDVHFVSQALRWARKVKTAREVRSITAAAAAAEVGIKAVNALARPGVTELELVREFERAVAGVGARAKFSHIKIGRGGVAGQTRPSNVALRRGDAIWFDVGCVVDGYWADIARVSCLGEPSDKLVRYYAAMKAGCDRAYAEAKPGMTGGELFDLTVDAVHQAGVPHYRRNHVGHGIGVELYDRVNVTPGNTDDLEEGVVVNIETPYYEFGLGAVQVEDPFLVTATGNQLLTTLDRDLIVLD